MSEQEGEYGPEFEERAEKAIERLEKILRDNPDLSYGKRLRYTDAIRQYRSWQEYRKQIKQLEIDRENNKAKRKENLQLFSGTVIIIVAPVVLIGILYIIKLLSGYIFFQILFIIICGIGALAAFFDRLHWIKIKNRKYDNSRVKGIRRKN